MDKATLVGGKMISDQYAAGFFDGEGTVFAAMRNKRPSPTLLVCISNTVREPLDLMQERWGGSICRVVDKNGRRQDQYQWTLAAKMAKPFLEAIAPHVIIKRYVVEQGIAYCKLMETPAKDRLDYSIRSGQRVRPEFRERVTRIHSRIRELNSARAPFNATRQYDA